MAQVVVLLHDEGSEDRCRRNRAGHFPTQQGLGDQIQIPSFEVDGCKKWSPPPDLLRTILSGLVHGDHLYQRLLRSYSASLAMPASMSSRFTSMYFRVSVVDS